VFLDHNCFVNAQASHELVKIAEVGSLELEAQPVRVLEFTSMPVTTCLKGSFACNVSSCVASNSVAALLSTRLRRSSSVLTLALCKPSR
jgi:hypothetical protein